MRDLKPATYSDENHEKGGFLGRGIPPMVYIDAQRAKRTTRNSIVFRNPCVCLHSLNE